jgi:autotransporter-associated beta strand protein
MNFLKPFDSPALLAGILLAASSSVAPAEQAGTSPVKIFIMAGQSNMLGKGTISPATTPGTLDYLVANDPDGRYQFLKSGGSYVVREDVWIRDQDPVAGGLTVGYGGEASGLIGPELGFGHVMGDADESQILIVKCAWGGRDLAFNFCPPSSRPGDPEPVTSADKGFYYKEILRLVNEAKANLGTYFPNYNGGGYQIAGFAWHQGWNDRIDVAKSAAYETNMANFINDIRNDLGAPNMPFVIATTGMDGLDGYGYTQVEKAQLKMADAAAYPAFAGNVAVIDTRGTYGGFDFWQSIAASPADENYHWNRNARTYLHIGLAMGDAMSLLAPGRCPYRLRASGGSGGVTLTWKNGTAIPNSVRVLRNGVEIAAAAPADAASFTDASAPHGVNNYEFHFTMPGNPCPPLILRHNSGITGLHARDRINGLVLSWQNNLGYSLIRVKRNGTVIAAALPGSTTSYVDPSPPAGAVTYRVEPADDGSLPAEIQVTVSAVPKGTALIYEPFDMPAGSLLRDQSGGLGLDGTWAAGATNEVATGSLTFGTLPVFGNRIVRSSGNGSCSINSGTTLADAGLLDHGAELWFSFLCPNPDNINVSPALVLGNETLGNSTTVANSGSAIGVRLVQGKSVEGTIFAGGGVAASSPTQATLGTSELALVVGRISWGATPFSPDTIEVFTPGTNLVPDTPQSVSAVVDQSAFRVISMWGNVTAPNIDEIRFGATFEDVTGQGVDTSGDLTAPVPATMSFASPPTAVSDSAINMTAVTASDANGVQYRFHNVTLGTFSPWQSSPTFTNTGLAASTVYAYSVQARDKSVNQNANVASAPVSATTLTPDTNAPPTPGFATPPTPVSATEITMTATAVADPEGGPVLYRFHNTTLGTDSGWQPGTTYNAADMTPNTTYSFAVRARDTAATPNESAPSAPLSATTLGPTNGTWGFDSDGNWGDSGKWLGNLVATGSGATAFFIQNITANRTITLDGDRSIGNITFTDSTTASYDLTIAGAKTLTLDVPSGSPVINVTQSGRTLTLSSVITGSKGLQKSGAGRLLLGGGNTYTGITSVAGGQLDLGAVSLAGFGGGSGRNFDVSIGAAVRRNALDNAFLNRMVETAAEITVMSGTTGNSLDFSSSTGANLPNAFLGNWAGNGAKMTYSGTLTPAADNYRLGSPTSNGLLGITSVLGGTHGLIVGGSRVNLVAANTYTGDTVIRTGAKLTLGNNLALQNSALDLGAAGGNFALAAGTNGGRITGETAAASPTFGGLKGSRNLLSAFTSSAGNNETNLASTAVTGFTLNPGAGRTCTYSGTIANFASATTLTKTGQGTQVLSGVNTYTGATMVNQGTLAIAGGSQASPITVATGAFLGFTLGSPTTSTSSVNLANGRVRISGTPDNASDYLLISASAITGTPTLDAPIPGYELKVQAGPVRLVLAFVGIESPYDAWSGGAPADGDSNNDGVDDGIAWALGAADPDQNAVSLLPEPNNDDPVYFIFTFKRGDAANADPKTAITVQYGSDLNGWITAVDDDDKVEIEVTPGIPADTVVVKLKRSALAADRKLFARLNVRVTP